MSNSAGTPGAITRRQMIRRIGLTALIAGPGAGLLSACATSGGEAPAASASAAPSAGGAVSAANPLGVAADAPLEVVIFNGGFGDKYATDVHEPLYKKAFPKAEIKHSATQADRRPCCSRGSPAATRRSSSTTPAAKLMDFGALVAGRSAPGPHRAVRRAVGRRPEQEGPRHRRPRHRRAGLVQRQAVRPELRLHRLRHLVLRQAVRGERLDRRRRPGTSSPPCCDKIKAKGIAPVRLRRRERRRTTSGT